ncbi:DUF2075 domain-containing protein [Dehalococcoidia bacterium]|nr:DUF2075 domain-containing protein [Dehalococcoidia bacterium]
MKPKKAGWQSTLQRFQSESSSLIQSTLRDFVGDVSFTQDKAWAESIPMIQSQAEEIMRVKKIAANYGTVLEYTLDYDYRRPDVIILTDGPIFVIELKGKSTVVQADIDQVSAYVRDIRAYHRECHYREVLPILIPTRTNSRSFYEKNGVTITPPNQLNELLKSQSTSREENTLSLDEFLSDNAYCPLPSLVQAARELFQSRTIRDIWRAKAATDPCVETITEITKEAAQTQSRHLILVTGIPGSGKTLAGMRAVHSPILDELSVNRGSVKPTVPGLYLTGNGPLSEVLQYELSRSGGGGRTFVRHIKSYLDRYVSRPNLVPSEHLLVFDEAQRAFSPNKVEDVHKNWVSEMIASEPELFIRICDRMPEWSVMVGLIGGGQEIHLGEEEGLDQWREALEKSSNDWTVHIPQHLSETFGRSSLKVLYKPTLNLDKEIRFHLVNKFANFVSYLLNGDSKKANKLAKKLIEPDKHPSEGIKIYVTRNLEVGKSYLKTRYEEAPEAKFGIVASSRDRTLKHFGVDNTFMGTKNIKIGPWFAEAPDHELSCRQFNQVVTEFGCQGLELDMTLLAWGTDLVYENNSWNNDKASKYRQSGRTSAKDPLQMRINAYRVLLTRGRDGVIIFIPQIEELDSTYDFLINSGVQILN